MISKFGFNNLIWIAVHSPTGPAPIKIISALNIILCENLITFRNYENLLGYGEFHNY